METPFTAQLAEFVKKHEGTRTQARKDKNVVAFLAVRSDIESALAVGYSVKTVWKFLAQQEKITYRYETFAKHVRRFIKHKETDQRKSKTPSRASNKPEITPTPALKPATATGFTFNPQPKMEDYI